MVNQSARLYDVPGNQYGNESEVMNADLEFWLNTGGTWFNEELNQDDKNDHQGLIRNDDSDLFDFQKAYEMFQSEQTEDCL